MSSWAIDITLQDWYEWLNKSAKIYQSCWLGGKKLSQDVSVEKSRAKKNIKQLSMQT